MELNNPNKKSDVLIQPNLLQDIENLLEENIQIGPSFGTTQPGTPKILHWFEWTKKKLNIYDIQENRMQYIDLEIPFVIPSFTRSIIIPTS